MRWNRLLLLVLLAGGNGCSVNDTVAVLPVADSCEDQGPPSLVVDGATGREACRGELAARLFQQAICLCEGMAASAPLVTDGFQSSLAPWTKGGSGGSVALNGSLIANAEWMIRGSLLVGGTPGDIQLASQSLSIAGELRTAGSIDGSQASMSVGGDAWVEGDLRLAALTVGGVLTLPAEREFSVTGERPGSVRREPISPLGKPCPCDSSIEDIPAYVKNHVTVNDNASLPLEPEALANFPGDRVQELRCGRFYLRGISGEGTARLVVKGRSALFVDGDVKVKSFLVTLEEGAELDLFISGTMSVQERFGLDSDRYPSRLRVYVGSAETIDVLATNTLVGLFYAPKANLALWRDLDLFGALFTRRLDAGGALSIHYDSDVLGLGTACTDPAPGSSL